jgi:UDP-3-O-[3-hydroxymyristoyl] glucosamine N-acyltransferase
VDAHHAAQLATTKAAAVIVPKTLKLPAMSPAVGACTLVVEQVDVAVNQVLALFAPPVPRPAEGVDGLARIDPAAVLAAGVRVGPFVSIGARTRIGRNSVVHAGVYIGEDVVVGEDCELFPNVVIRERCTLGNRVIIHANSTVGSDGFGYHWDGRKHAKIPHIGVVMIADDVEIGSNACIDRAKFSATVVGPGTKIDNLVQVAHNVRTGAHCMIVAQVGLAGSVTLGNGVVLGGQAAVRDHITMGDGAMAAGCSGVANDVEAKDVVSGVPARSHRQHLREQAAVHRLPELAQQVRKLDDEMRALKGKLGMVSPVPTAEGA